MRMFWRRRRSFLGLAGGAAGGATGRHGAAAGGELGPAAEAGEIVAHEAVVLFDGERQVLAGEHLIGRDHPVVSLPVVGDEGPASQARLVDQPSAGRLITSTRQPGRSSHNPTPRTACNTDRLQTSQAPISKNQQSARCTNLPQVRVLLLQSEDCLADRGTTNAHISHQAPFRRQVLAGTIGSFVDLPFEMLDDVLVGTQGNCLKGSGVPAWVEA